MKKILVCDDDDGILEVIKIVLEEKGYEVISLSNPEKVQNTVKTEKPELILLDLWMPSLNGDAITLALKSDKDTKDIPVIIISANKDTEFIAEKIGANSFLAKPFNIDELENLVARYII